MEIFKNPAPAEASAPETDDFSPRKLIVKACLLLMFLAGGLILLFFTPLRGYLGQYREITVRLGNMGGYAPVIFMCGSALLVFFGMPRLL